MDETLCPVAVRVAASTRAGASMEVSPDQTVGMSLLGLLLPEHLQQKLAISATSAKSQNPVV